MKKCIYNPFEAQLDVGVMMKNLISNTKSMGGKIITGINVKKVNENGKVKIKGNYEKGNKSGEWQYFDENGVLLETKNFDQE